MKYAEKIEALEASGFTLVKRGTLESPRTVLVRGKKVVELSEGFTNILVREGKREYSLPDRDFESRCRTKGKRSKPRRIAMRWGGKPEKRGKKVDVERRERQLRNSLLGPKKGFGGGGKLPFDPTSKSHQRKARRKARLMGRK